MTRDTHDRIWQAVRDLGAASAVCALGGDLEPLLRTRQLVVDAIESLRGVQDMGSVELQLSIQADIERLEGRVAAMDARIRGLRP